MESTQDRVDFLEQVTHEHECFQASVDEFQLWLKAVVERVDGCMGRKCRLPRPFSAVAPHFWCLLG